MRSPLAARYVSCSEPNRPGAVDTPQSSSANLAAVGRHAVRAGSPRARIVARVRGRSAGSAGRLVRASGGVAMLVRSWSGMFVEQGADLGLTELVQDSPAQRGGCDRMVAVGPADQ